MAKQTREERVRENAELDRAIRSTLLANPDGLLATQIAKTIASRPDSLDPTAGRITSRLTRFDGVDLCRRKQSGRVVWSLSQQGWEKAEVERRRRARIEADIDPASEPDAETLDGMILDVLSARPGDAWAESNSGYMTTTAIVCDFLHSIHGVTPGTSKVKHRLASLTVDGLADHKRIKRKGRQPDFDHWELTEEGRAIVASEKRLANTKTVDERLAVHAIDSLEVTLEEAENEVNAFRCAAEDNGPIIALYTHGSTAVRADAVRKALDPTLAGLVEIEEGRRNEQTLRFLHCQRRELEATILGGRSENQIDSISRAVSQVSFDALRKALRAIQSAEALVKLRLESEQLYPCCQKPSEPR